MSQETELQQKINTLSKQFNIPCSDDIKNTLMYERGVPFPKNEQRDYKTPTCFQSKRRLHKKEEAVKKTYEKEITPGFIYRKKSDHNIQVVLNEQFWNEQKPQAQSLSRQTASRFSVGANFFDTNFVDTNFVSRDSLEPLEKKVGQLTIQIQEMKLDHEDVLTNFQTEQANFLKKKDEQNQETVRFLEERNISNLENLQMEHQRFVDEVIYEKNREIMKLKDEIKFLEEKFKVHTKFVNEEMERKWEVQKNDYESEMELKTQKRLDEQRTEMKKEIEMITDRLTAHNNKSINSLLDSHQREMDKLLEKYANNMQHAKKLNDILIEVKLLKDENETLKEDLKETLYKLRKTEYELDDVKIQLKGYKNQFSEKLTEVEENFSGKTNNLILENAELRKLYLHKCEEMYKLRYRVDIKQAESIEGAKDLLATVVVNSKLRSSLDLKLGGEHESREKPYFDTNNQVNMARPSSAPGTKAEQIFTRWKSRKQDQLSYLHDENLTSKQNGTIPSTEPLKLPAIWGNTDLQ